MPSQRTTGRVGKLHASPHPASPQVVAQLGPVCCDCPPEAWGKGSMTGWGSSDWAGQVWGGDWEVGCLLPPSEALRMPVAASLAWPKVGLGAQQKGQLPWSSPSAQPLGFPVIG